MLVPHLDEYATKYQHIKFDRQDGILQVTLHTEHKDLVWGFLPHQELGYCFGDIGSDPENKVIIFTGSGETFIHKEDLSGSKVDAKAWAEHVLPDAKRLLMNVLEIQAPTGSSGCRAATSVPCGALIFSTMMVMMIAMTPSLKASGRFFCMCES
jgi:enoyl-CoA hydratase/carnithine racemase